MIHTIEQLKSGQLLGVKTLKLSCGLTEFPEEIVSLAETLEVLDLSDNQLTSLPDSIAQLKHLKVLFFARNKFTEFPAILALFPQLSMIGFKSNQITTIPEQAFPPFLNWLILTDNKIEKLPKSIGDCARLQKLTIAGNQIEELPDEMAKCVNLELIRISDSNLTSIPSWLFELPKLSWVAFGGNPATYKTQNNSDLETYPWHDFEIKELLGEGASGLISKAFWESKNKEVAIKVFKGDVTSDGLPEDEMAASIAAGAHANLIPVLGEIIDHPEGKRGLILKLIASDFVNLGNPPSLESCTRDVFDEESVFNESELFNIAKSIASVCAQLHCKGINHGDLYAHNILVNKTADCLLGDFGAASFYDRSSAQAHIIERVEVRAFGCLIEDVLGLVSDLEPNSMPHSKWLKLITDCTIAEVGNRLSFYDVLEELKGF